MRGLCGRRSSRSQACILLPSMWDGEIFPGDGKPSRSRSSRGTDRDRKLWAPCQRQERPSIAKGMLVFWAAGWLAVLSMQGARCIFPASLSFSCSAFPCGRAAFRSVVVPPVCRACIRTDFAPEPPTEDIGPTPALGYGKSAESVQKNIEMRITFQPEERALDFSLLI